MCEQQLIELALSDNKERTARNDEEKPSHDPLPLSAPATDSLPVLESWCEMCMRGFESAPAEEQSITDCESLSHHHPLYILFKLLVHSPSFAPAVAELPLSVLLPLFPSIIQSTPISSLLALIVATKSSVSQFLLSLLSVGEDKLDPSIRQTLQRRFPSLLSEARLLCRDLQRVVDSKYLALRSYLSSCSELSLSAPALERVQHILESPVLPIDCWMSQRVQSILEEGVPLEDLQQILSSMETQEGKYLANYVPTLVKMRDFSLRFGKVVIRPLLHVVLSSVRRSARILLG